MASFLFLKVASFTYPPEKQVIATQGTTITSNMNDLHHAMLGPCDHEEADTRLIVHLVDALERGKSTCLVRTVDTDVPYRKISTTVQNKFKCRRLGSTRNR